jgi:class 3 adenylate cyclase/predicted ATPase
VSERTGGHGALGSSDPSPPVDELLDRAVAAVNRGDVATAHELAGAVLDTDTSNRDAAALLAESEPGGEVRRASLLFADLVGSTALSARHEPELYRGVVRRYKALCRRVIEERYGGHVSHVAGDGMLAVFGLPTPHENDAERAVRAGLDIVRELRDLSSEVERAVGERLNVRAAVHKGLVYLDGDDVYGLAANVASRLQGLAAPGTVVISDEVQKIVGALFETAAEPAQRVKGVDEPLRPFRVVAERPEVPARGRQWAGPLVDRTAERAAVHELWDQARRSASERPCGVHITGEAGIGKSRLASVVLDEMRSETGARIELSGSPLHPDASFHPIRALIEARCGIGRDVGSEIRFARLSRELQDVGLEADELVHLLAPVLDIPPDAGYDAARTEGHKLRDAIVDAAARYLLACLGPGRATLLVEDVHWCDEATVDVVRRVLGAERPDLVVIATSRHPPPAGLRTLRVIALVPLDADESAELVRALDPEIEIDSCRELVARGDGVPLFLEELVRGAAVTSGGSTVDLRAAPPDDWNDDPSVAPGTVPDALYEPLVTRLYATASGVPVAAAAATIGRDVDRGLLGSVLDMPEPELEQALTDLLGGLILERAADDDRYRFRHELLREVAYGLQPPSHRRRLHGRVADVLIGQAGEGDVVDWRLVARHFDRAGRSSEAIAAYQRAADGAQRLGALAEARVLLERAIELVAGLPDGRDRQSREVGLRLRRGFLAVSAEGNSSVDAVRDYERCLEIALVDAAGDEMFSTLISLWGYYVIRGDLTRAERVAEMLRSALPGRREDYEPDNEAAFGAIRWYAGDFVEARERLESAVAQLTARASGRHYASTWFMPDDAWAGAHSFLALARFVTGDIHGADEQLVAALERCSALEFPQSPYSAAAAHAYHVWTQIERGDLAAARDEVEELGALGDQHGFDVWVLVSATQRAAVAGLQALAAAADASVLSAHAQALDGFVATWQMLDIAVFLPFYMAIAARLRVAGGEIAEARSGIDRALDVARVTGMHFYDAELMRLRARVGIGDTDHVAMATRLREAFEVARLQGALLFELRIARDLLDCEGADDLRLVAQVAARFPHDAHFPDLDEARARLAART